MRPADIELESIQSMLVAGHRSVHLERHTLVLWGSVGGFLCVATDFFLTTERFPDTRQRALVLLLWLGAWLGTVALVDHRLTRRVRSARSETLPFAQAQITRAWWMLLAMGSLGSFAMFFHGGGRMIYALWIVLLGLGIYLFGLFSRALVEWIGLATILLGVASLASGLPFETTRWLAASAFAIGLPFAGWLGARADAVRTAQRVLALAAWIVVVVAAALLVPRLAPHLPAPAAAAVPLDTYHAREGEQVVSVPAGTVVPLQVELEGPLLAALPGAGLPIMLNRSIDVALLDGQPDGRYRFVGSPWHRVQDGLLLLRIDRIRPRLVDGKPVFSAQAIFHVEGLQEVER